MQAELQTEKRLLPLQAQEAAVAELRGLWTEIGLPAQEVEQKLVAFSGELHAVLSNAVRAEEEGRTALHAEVPQLCEELRALCEVVEADHPALEAERDAEMLVVPRHRALKAGAEALRSLRAERLTQRSEREAKLGALLGELHADGAQPEGALAAPAVPGADQPNGLARGTLEQLDASVAAAEAERATRAEHVAALSAETAQLRAELGEAEEHAASPPVAITIAGIAEAEDGLNRLRAERARRLRTLMQASEYIAELCNKLKLSDGEIVTLPSPEAGLSRKVMAQYTAELERLEAMKAEKIGLLLADARARLRPLWQEMHMSEAETRAVTIAWDDADDADGGADAEQLNKMEEMLWAVEAEERRLHEKIEATSKIFSLMGRREEILGQREEMRALANDPNRLFAKGRGAASARLREEKLRVAVEKDLPKMNRRLREIVGAYQEANAGEILKFNGVPVLEAIDGQEAADVREKEEEKARKEAERLEKAEAKRAAKDAAAGITPRGGTLPRGASAGTKRPASAAAGAKRTKTDAAKPPQHAVPSERVLQSLGIADVNPE